MPILKLSIQSFSSEDERFPAKNLIINPVKKWQCSSATDKSAYVIFKLQDPEEICGIDVGNNHSAFVTVFVARSDTPTVWKEILLTSSFMTPAESRESTYTSRVRCFQTETLIEHTRKMKWDLLKVQCSQPFNKHVPYGISFITLHSVPKKKEKEEADVSFSVKKDHSPKKAAPTSFGKFKLARSGSESSDEGSASAFQKWRNSKKTGETSPSSKLTQKNEPTLKEKIQSMKKAEKRRQSFKDDDTESSSNQKLDRNRNSLLYDMEDDLPNEKLEKKMKLDKSSSSSSSKVETPAKSSKKPDLSDEATKRKFDFLFDNNPPDRSSSCSTSKSKSSDHRSKKDTPKKSDRHSRHDSPRKSDRSDKSTSSSRHSRHDDSKSSKSTPSKSSSSHRDSNKKTPEKRSSSSKHPVTYQPFRKLLSGVVFVISGIQNPDRNDLRKKALDIGAKYKSDWDSSCTHLICAFKNTPKYVQVLGEGKIVTKHWIEKCYKEKKRLSWRKFAMEESEKDKDDSEGEIFDTSLKLDTPNKRESKPEVNRNRIQYSSDDDMEVVVVPAKPTPQVDIVESSDEDMAIVVSNKEAKSPTKKNINEPIQSSKSQEKVVDIEPKEIPKKKSNDTDDELDTFLPAFEAKKVDLPLATNLDCSTDEELDFSGKDTMNGSGKLANRSGNSVDDTQVLDDGKNVLNDKQIFLNRDLSAIDEIKLKKNISFLKGQITANQEEAHYIIALKKGNVTGKFTGVIVKPLWIYECNDMECLIPTSRYQL